jgi:hypothetical protein
MLFLPRCPDFAELRAEGKEFSRADWIAELLPPEFKEFPLERVYPYFASSILFDHYARYRHEHEDREPDWIKKSGPATQRLLRYDWAIRDEKGDLYLALPSIPLTGVRCVIKDGGLIEDVVGTFSLRRLEGIKQLGGLHDPIIKERFPLVGLDFPHTRFCHVLEVSVILALILWNNNASSAQMRNGRTAALVHDVMTPAGGDTTKLIDPEGFDEDLHFPEFLDALDWRGLEEKYSLSREILVDTVQGRGVLGKVLDLADKVAYVGRDAFIYLTRFDPQSQIGYGPQYRLEEVESMKEVANRRRHVCDIWDTVRIAGEQVYVNDPWRLADFLMLRALLFKGLYYNPGARFVEYGLKKFILSELYQANIITREWLLTHVDYELDWFLGELFNHPYFHGFAGLFSNPVVDSFHTKEEAERNMEALRGSGRFAFIENIIQRTSSGGSILTLHEGKVMPFEEALPGQNALVSATIRPEKPFRLYHCIPPQSWDPAKIIDLEKAMKILERRR